MYNFCTYFDHRYLSNGLALYRSLRQHCPEFKIWVLCMDSQCYDTLLQLNLANMHLITLAEFEQGDDELLKAKSNRTVLEYYYTCTSSLPLFILNNFPEVDRITYLDADLFFFADPKPIFDEIAEHSIAIIGHRFPEHLRKNEHYGIYNVGWLSFRRDENAYACLRWWRERCLEWCYVRIEPGRFADQKYLDDWPSRFRGVVVLRHKGANLAPWNMANYNIHGDNHYIRVDKQPLIFFHFSGLKHLEGRIYNPDSYLSDHRVKLNRFVLRRIYSLYIQTLLELKRQSLPLLKMAKTIQPAQDISYLRRMVRRFRRLLYLGKGVLSREYIIFVNGRVI